MSGHDEDDAWRSIVENYGERPHVDLPPPAPEPEPAWHPSYDGPDDRFVPPEPEPVPTAPPLRMAAWLGVFVAPSILLVALVLPLPLPTWTAYAMVAWFVGGFGYLVWHMDRGPRDPGDDGARL